MSYSSHSSEPPKRRRRLRVLFLALAFVLLAGLVMGIIAIQSLRAPAKGNVVEIDVARGDSVRVIAELLQKKGLIRNAFAFRVYYYLAAHHTTLLAGQYRIQMGLSISEILDQLAAGRIISNAITVTIPEGYTVKQMAARLSAEGVCSATAFLESTQHDDFTEPFLKSVLPAGPSVKYRLEGYLFPDTYTFRQGETAHDVVNEMLMNFQKHIDGQVVSDMAQQHLTLAQVITEASLIEKEAKVEQERPIIASVIDNRLKIHMALQIDATLQYILGHQNIVTTADAKVKDPYNTYLYPGLPPGPIASPGMASIEAVLHPKTTNYLYYVVKNDGSGESYFARTYAEQLHNEQLSQENLQKYGH